ncbi:MAG: hypothetical protein ACT4OO_09750 [Nitrospiraceae bacterium]
MKHLTMFIVLIGSFFLIGATLAQIHGRNQDTPAGSIFPGAMPADLRGNIKRLAEILQQNLNEGKLTDAQIQQELQQGDLGSVVGGLSPEANKLLEEIRTSLQQNENSESLSLLLQLLANPGR